MRVGRIIRPVLSAITQKANAIRSTTAVVFRVLNAADFGVPQRRERVIIVGFRNDLDFAWSFPERHPLT